MELKIGSSLRRLRQERGITQEELANALCITAQAVSKWERNEGYPEITLLPDIAEYFGVTLDTLCGIDEERKQKEISSILTANAFIASSPYFPCMDSHAHARISSFKRTGLSSDDTV